MAQAASGASLCWQGTLYPSINTGPLTGNPHKPLAWKSSLAPCPGAEVPQCRSNSLANTLCRLPDGALTLLPCAGVLQQLLAILPNGQQLAALIIYLTEEAAAAQEADREQPLPDAAARQGRGNEPAQAVAHQLAQVKGPAAQPLVSLYQAACKVVEDTCAPALEREGAQPGGADDVTTAPASVAEQTGGRARQTGSKRSAAALSADTVSAQRSDDNRAAARHKKRKGAQSAGSDQAGQQEGGPAAAADDVEQLLSEAADRRW